MLQQMRWTDNSMGSNFDYGWSDINQAFAAGNVGMYISGSDVYTNLVSGQQHRPEHLRRDDDPARQEHERRRPRRRHARRGAARRERGRQLAAAVKWIDFYYEQPLIEKAQAIRNAKTLVAVEAAGRRSGAAGLQQGAVRLSPTPGSSRTSTSRRAR